jgi:hypothetical protein
MPKTCPSGRWQEGRQSWQMCITEACPDPGTSCSPSATLPSFPSSSISQMSSPHSSSGLLAGS